ncbi:FAD-dependent oxidoreductase [uncultured Tateyamaria sp.]|uniref:FAD-dependent oxidoreductase n=1 Tax=uncultured Tateyamaria sp. TaxID=455651 RepID=UPI0026177685|nr:FAD-dependent oxidoreductase [uncultured Tateyamaria sp.]
MNEKFDVAVIGLGPAGILAAHGLAETSSSILLVDSNAVIGGAAFETDVNLQNITGFPPQSEFGQRTLGSRALADSLALKSYDALHGYGLPYKPVNSTDRYSYAVDEPTLRKVVANFHSQMIANPRVDLRLQTTMEDVAPGTDRRWQISLASEGRIAQVEADHVIIATGKLSAIWLPEFLRKLEISYTNRPTFALGFRVEELAQTVNSVARGCENPKIRIVRNGVVTETFCWCKNGAVMAYDFGGARLLDGLHCYGRPQTNTSFGVITTVELPSGASNMLASVAFSRYVSALAEGRVLLQRLADFKHGQPSNAETIAANPVVPSLHDYRLSNLPSYFPSAVVKGFLELIDEINSLTPGAVTDNALVYAPILERVFPDIRVSRNLETNREGIYFIGDCSGQGVGVAPAAVMGLAVAQYIQKGSVRR